MVGHNLSFSSCLWSAFVITVYYVTILENCGLYGDGVLASFLSYNDKFPFRLFNVLLRAQTVSSAWECFLKLALECQVDS
jgi:hypothetical protein